MRLSFCLLAALPLIAASSNFSKRQTLPINNPCQQNCAIQADREAAALGCTDNSVCLCSTPSYRANVEACLRADCPADATEAILAVISQACATWVPTTPSASPTSSPSPSTPIPEVTVPPIGVVPEPSPSDVTQTPGSGVANFGSVTFTSSATAASARPTQVQGNPTGGVGTGGGVAGSQGNPTTLARVTTGAGGLAPSNSTSSRAWAAPTAVTGLAGVMLAAAGAVLAA